ncbi:19959_t:CDS:2 [Entrophospora sp. SA101]|nr:19959_t:CDS:2 [Entrophospora sp. SA101]
MKGTPSEPQHALKLVWAGTKIKALNVLEDVELRNGIKEYSNWPTIPQVYVKAEFVGDCDIVLNMHQSGELEELLVEICKMMSHFKQIFPFNESFLVPSFMIIEISKNIVEERQ